MPEVAESIFAGTYVEPVKLKKQKKVTGNRHMKVTSDSIVTVTE